MRNIQTKAFLSPQMNSTLEAMQRGGRGIIEGLYPERPVPGTSRSQPLAPTGGRPVRWRRPQTTLQQLKLRPPLNAAERSGSVAAFPNA